MPNTILSRVFGAQSVFGQDSIYDTIRQTEDDAADGDVEARAGLLPIAHDEEFGFPNVEYSHQPGPSTHRVSKPLGKSVYYPGQSHIEGEEVPASLLIEDGEFGQKHPMLEHEPPRAIPAYGDPLNQSIWTPPGLGPAYSPPTRPDKTKKLGLAAIDPRERAMWKWTNVENLDNFLEDVYFYFTENGMYSIILARVLNLLTLGFVVGFTTFLSLCIDHGKISGSKKLSQITVPHCMTRMSPTWTFFLWLFSLFWIMRAIQFLVDIRRLVELRNFFTHLLEIPDSDIQTVSWPTVVERLMALRDANPFTTDATNHRNFFKNYQKQRMDAHDIANRIMRRENYLIALFNKDVLDLTIPLPFLRNQGGWLTKTLEWNLNLCVIDYFISARGTVHKAFLKSENRKALAEGLRRRFMIAGVLNVVFAPFIVAFSLIVYFLRYFNEFQKNPGQIGSRQYTPLAEWKFREFNELPHLFQRRLNMSYPFASRYVDQFPKDKTVQLSRFITFVAGSFAAVLAIASVIDTELVHLEITSERTVLFYIGLFGTILAVSRGMIPEETLVYDPEAALRAVIEYTHYLPTEWKNKLHSDEVKREFMKLYDVKVSIFLQELLSIIFLPFVLWFSLPKSSDRIIDFIREFSLHVDGIGYVCSFAVFDFKKNAGDQAPEVQEDFYASENKMITSYLGFMDNYGPNRTPGHGSGKRNPPPAITTQQRAEMRGTPASVAKQTARQAPKGPNVGSLRNRGPYNASASITQSTLLDKHHQPLSFSRKLRGASLLRHESSTDLKEEDEGEDESSPFAAYRKQGKGKQKAKEERYTDEDGAGSTTSKDNYDSDLGDSFMSTGMGDGLEGDAEDQASGPGPEEAGVLNLIYQFQKAHGEKMVQGID